MLHRRRIDMALKASVVANQELDFKVNSAVQTMELIPCADGEGQRAV